MIWRLGYWYRYERYRLIERAKLVVVWRLPRWIVYWCTIRAYAKAWEDAGNKTPDELTYDEVAKAAERV